MASRRSRRGKGKEAEPSAPPPPPDPTALERLPPPDRVVEGNVFSTTARHIAQLAALQRKSRMTVVAAIGGGVLLVGVIVALVATRDETPATAAVAEKEPEKAVGP